MEEYNTNIYEKLLSGINLPEIIRQEVEGVVNKFMRTECTAFLGYERYSHDNNSDDYRNGEYSRKVMTQYGELNIVVPRDRNGEFKQHTLPPYKRTLGDLETTIITLYMNHITTREISDLIEKMYGKYYSPATISNISKAIDEDVKAFHNRRLPSRYVVIYADSTYLNIRRGSVGKEALHVFVGITPEGNMEVIDYELFPTESADNYMTMLRGFKERGLEEVLLFVTDGLKGFREAILQEFPRAEHQVCWVHMQRNAMHKVRISDREEVAEDLKKVYNATSKDEAEKALTAFCEKYKGRYPKVTTMFDDRRSLFSFFDFPIEIRNSLYTTNVIENMNKHLKRIVKAKEQFPSEDSLDKTVYCHYSEFNSKHYGRVYYGFGQCQKEIDDMFDTRYPKDRNEPDREPDSSPGGGKAYECEVAT